jgi:hypothetical protein
MDYGWVSTFVGVPFCYNGRDVLRDGGLDCYGLVLTVLREHRPDIDLPDWVVDSFTPQATALAVTSAVEGELASHNARQVTDPEDFDIAVLSRARLATHVGLVIGGGVLHVASDMPAGAVWEPMGRFIQLRGMPLFYRWERLH